MHLTRNTEPTECNCVPSVKIFGSAKESKQN